jgi:hypothetical protein
MPIYHEGLVKGDPPSDFNKFVLDFYKKISRKLKFKEMGFYRDSPEEYIKENKDKWKFIFKLTDENFWVGSTKGALVTGAVGAIGGVYASQGATIAMRKENEKREKPEYIRLNKIIKDTGMFKKVVEHGGQADMDFVAPSKDTKYIFHAWSAVVYDSGYFTTHSIDIACQENKGGLKIHNDRKSSNESGISFNDTLEGIYNAYL